MLEKHCVLVPSFQNNQNFWNERLVEQNCNNFPVYLCFFLFIIIDTNAVWMSILEWL